MEDLHNHFTLVVYIESIIFKSTNLVGLLDDLSGNAAQPVSIPTLSSSAAARQVVRTAAKVQITPYHVIQHRFNRVKSAKPCLAISAARTWPERHWFLDIYPEPRKDSDSWIETYWAYCGLWDLELFCYIYQNMLPCCSWSKHDLDSLAEEYVKPAEEEEIDPFAEPLVRRILSISTA
jgi:hypothetical protein